MVVANCFLTNILGDVSIGYPLLRVSNVIESVHFMESPAQPVILVLVLNTVIMQPSKNHQCSYVDDIRNDMDDIRLKRHI